MVGNWVRTRARERIEAIGAAPLDAQNLRIRMLYALHDVVDFDAYLWLLTDPVSTVGTAPLADVPNVLDLSTLVKTKYVTSLNRWTTLEHRTPPVALLHEAADDDAGYAQEWRDFLRRYGIGDVASTAFADQFGCWGFLDLWRDSKKARFNSTDTEFLIGVAASLTAALRSCQARTFSSGTGPHQPVRTVVLTLDDNLKVTTPTSESQDLLELVFPEGPGQRAILASVCNVAAQLLATETGVDSHPASSRAHLADGIWLTLRASRAWGQEPSRAQPGAGGIPIEVRIEETSAAGRLELFARAFGLTDREHEVLTQAAGGSDLPAIARLMALDEHTVTTAFEYIYAKTGSPDRLSVLSRALGRGPGPAS